MRQFVAALLSVAIAASAHAQATHDEASRDAYVASVLRAVAEATPAAREQAVAYTRAFVHGACAARSARLEVECLMTAARRYCHEHAQPNCDTLLDVVISNVLGEPRLVSNDKRYQIMRTFKDYRAELAAELRRVAGALAVDFRLRMGGADDDTTLGRNLDRYCLATADDTGLPWQTCVSTLAWFIRAGVADAQ